MIIWTFYLSGIVMYCSLKRLDGRRAAGQHDVGAVVHRDIVRDVVDEGALASHVFEHFLKHICFSFLNKKQEAPTTGVSCKKP